MMDDSRDRYDIEDRVWITPAGQKALDTPALLGVVEAHFYSGRGLYIRDTCGQLLIISDENHIEPVCCPEHADSGGLFHDPDCYGP